MQGRCTILIDQRLWRVACVSAEGVRVKPLAVGPDATLEDKAAGAAVLIREMGGSGPVVLALPSSDCLTASILTDGLSRSGRRQSMGYLLEEQLPLSAEDAVADYVEQQGVALGVCADLYTLRSIVEALEALDVTVRHICPAALLIAQQMAEQQGSADALLIANGNADAPCDLIELSGRAPRRWWWLTDEQSKAQQLQALIEQAGEGEKPALLTLGSVNAIQGVEQSLANLPSSDEAAALQADRILSGQVSPWIDLRRDALAAPDAHELYQKQVGVLVAAAVLLLACLGGAMFYRGTLYEAEADRVRAEQIAVYKQAFPDSRVPSGSVLSRMRSELQRLQGIGGQAQLVAGGDNDELNPTSALTQLHDVMNALPKNLRYQVSDFTIEPNLVRFDGAAESSVVAEQVAGAVRSTGLYDVDPPSSRALNDFGVSFNVVARPSDKKPGATP